MSIAGQWQLLTTPFSLKQGALYAATLQLSFIERMAAKPQDVIDKFTQAGFSNVNVTDSLDRAEGTWDQPAADDVTLPSEVVRVWE
jgi:hypothetical protein